MEGSHAIKRLFLPEEQENGRTTIRRGSFLENAPLIFKACASFGGGAQAVNCAISAPTLAT
jgi:hypothetical protein